MTILWHRKYSSLSKTCDLFHEDATHAIETYITLNYLEQVLGVAQCINILIIVSSILKHI